MTKCFFFSLATLACLLTANAFGNDGIPNANVLDQMGLSGLQVTSDSDATAIRDKGYRHHGRRGPQISISGYSYANMGSQELGLGTGSENQYNVSGAHRFAEGSNGSFATGTLEMTKTYTHGRRTCVKNCVTTLTFTAGGSSYARAR